MKAFCVAVASLACALVLVAGAGAEPPQPSTGTGTVTPPALTNVRLADGTVHADFTQTGVTTGTFAGTIATTGQLVVFPDGQVFEQATIVFTGTTPCGTGTAVFEGNGHLIAGVGTAHVFTIDSAENTIGIQSVDDLALAGPIFTYSGTYHCGP